MFLIIGLGNPGKEYDDTRHNVGFDVLAVLAKQYALSLSKGEGSPFTNKRLLHAEILECNIADHHILLAKPTTYMNESGRAVAALTKKSEISNLKSQIVVLHDDLDLPVGALRLSVGGSSGGHKGVQSIIDALGTNDFLRLRIGIGPNATPEGRRIPSEKFVLEKFRKEERPLIDVAIARAVEAIMVLIRDGLTAAQRVAN